MFFNVFGYSMYKIRWKKRKMKDGDYYFSFFKIREKGKGKMGITI